MGAQSRFGGQSDSRQDGRRRPRVAPKTASRGLRRLMRRLKRLERPPRRPKRAARRPPRGPREANICPFLSENVIVLPIRFLVSRHFKTTQEAPHTNARRTKRPPRVPQEGPRSVRLECRYARFAVLGTRAWVALATSFLRWMLLLLLTTVRPLGRPGRADAGEGSRRQARACCTSRALVQPLSQQASNQKAEYEMHMVT